MVVAQIGAPKKRGAMGHFRGRRKLVTVVEKSRNSKIGDVAATYVTLQSCPSTCPLKDNGCYAQGGRVGGIVQNMNTYAEEIGATLLDIAIEEAQAIDDLMTMRPLRVHVSGDWSTDEAARIGSAAVRRFRERGGGVAWSYTHAHRQVERESWDPAVSVLASCETLVEVVDAMSRGWAAAMVVPEHPPDGKAHKVETQIGDATVIPCVNQTRGVTCTQCRLCWNSEALLERRAVIAFAVHGNRVKRVQQIIEDAGKII